jgi:predicted dehydrogenase
MGTRNPLGVGIVGLGYMAATHIKAYRQIEGFQITAICNPSGRNLDGDFSNAAGKGSSDQPLKLDMSQVKPYRNFTDMLADDSVDVIDICAPTHTHPDLAIPALKAGKHVLCEKTVARTSQLAEQIVKAAAASSGLFMPAMCLRFWPDWLWLKNAITSGAFGKVQAVRFRRVAQPPGWGQGFFLNGSLSGGALLDLHIHDVDFVQFCFGLPRRVFSSGFTKVSSAIDHVVTQYQVESGATVSAEGSWAMTEGFGFNMSYTAIFERATADYDSARGEDSLKLFEQTREPQVLRPGGDDGYVGQLRHFLQCISNREAKLAVTADDGARAIRICEAEARSIETGGIEDV